jgi:hypothetical protein
LLAPIHSPPLWLPNRSFTHCLLPPFLMFPLLFCIRSAATSCTTRPPETPLLRCRIRRDPTCPASSCFSLSRPVSFLHSPSLWSGRCPATSPCRSLPRARLLHPRWAVHSWSPFRVWPLTTTTQPEQHPADGGLKGDVRGVPGN